MCLQDITGLFLTGIILLMILHHVVFIYAPWNNKSANSSCLCGDLHQHLDQVVQLQGGAVRFGLLVIMKTKNHNEMIALCIVA